MYELRQWRRCHSYGLFADLDHVAPPIAFEQTWEQIPPRAFSRLFGANDCRKIRLQARIDGALVR